MPVHNFVCEACNIRIHFSTTKGVHKCPECGEDMWCQFSGSICGNYDHPIHSDAMAVHPSQRAEHEREFPNIRLDGQCRPILNNYKDHEAYLKKTGFVKAKQKIRNSLKSNN